MLRRRGPEHPHPGLPAPLLRRMQQKGRIGQVDPGDRNRGLAQATLSQAFRHRAGAAHRVDHQIRRRLLQAARPERRLERRPGDPAVLVENQIPEPTPLAQRNIGALQQTGADHLLQQGPGLGRKGKANVIGRMPPAAFVDDHLQADPHGGAAGRLKALPEAGQDRLDRVLAALHHRVNLRALRYAKTRPRRRGELVPFKDQNMAEMPGQHASGEQSPNSGAQDDRGFHDPTNYAASLMTNSIPALEPTQRPGFARRRLISNSPTSTSTHSPRIRTTVPGIALSVSVQVTVT